jgi:hypothetical protein
MSMDDRQYRLGAIEEDGQNVDDDDDRTELKKDDDSPLVFEFLKRKRPMPSARRVNYMLYAPLSTSTLE